MGYAEESAVGRDPFMCKFCLRFGLSSRTGYFAYVGSVVVFQENITKYAAQAAYSLLFMAVVNSVFIITIFEGLEVGQRLRTVFIINFYSSCFMANIYFAFHFFV